MKYLLIYRTKLRQFFISYFLYFIFFIFFYDISNEQRLGKGVLYKLTVLITDNEIIQKVLISSGDSCFIKIYIRFFQKKTCKFFHITFFNFYTDLYQPILQEYYDPLIFLLIFTFLKPKFLNKL